ncbi:hypothetical protein T440DRAFT_549993 [Plenodomus tracheiphilus IPT5]|uniref:Uncharacterized protein n=1 Tax=Plenodomus tracheiphilus IPT5 TaxID=1408161 RepID=A0A6A7BQ08_9PLEO|nr:hypothetical protein T440DRAFT_549993 [Plenodomus tracheiphilus IPT5]
MGPLDIFGVLHAPARLACRLLLSPKYFFRGVKPSEWRRDEYARIRYGTNYKWKPWLLFDIDELERVEQIVREASDDEILRLRNSQLDVTKLVAVVAALLAQAALSSLSLPKLEETHYSARALLTGSLILGLLALFFTCVQQREFGQYVQPEEIRAWLSTEEESGGKDRRSSIIAHQLLQAPFEMLGVSVNMFIAGLGVYEGSAFTRNFGLNTVNGIPDLYVMVLRQISA